MNTEKKLKLPLHLLIDGADRLGKTTVCELMSRGLDLPIIKMKNMPQYIEAGTSEEFSQLFNETVVQFAEYPFILDRGFTSSLVYSTIEQRPYDLEYIENIEKILKPKVFILTSQKNLGKDQIYSQAILEKVDAEFNKLANERNYHLISVYGKSPFEICNEILNALSWEEESPVFPGSSIIQNSK